MAKTNTAAAAPRARTLPPVGSLFLAFRAAGFGVPTDTAPAMPEDHEDRHGCGCEVCGNLRDNARDL